MRGSSLKVFGLIVLIAVLAGCGSSSKTSTPAAGVAQSASREALAPNVTAKVADQAGNPVVNGHAAATATPVPLDRKIIQNAQFDVKVKDADTAISQVGAAVRNAGGFVQETTRQGTKEQGRHVTMTLRVPAESYGSVTQMVSGLGEITNSREWTDDVTDQYVDLDARIKSQEMHLTELEKLYAKGGTIKEMMDVEQEISRVTGDLESMKGRMQVLQNQIDFSTVKIALYEPGVPTPIQPPKNIWERMQRGFMDSWGTVVNFTGNLVVFLAALVPVLVFLAVIGGVAFLVIRIVRLARKRKQQPPSND